MIAPEPPDPKIEEILKFPNERKEIEFKPSIPWSYGDEIINNDKCQEIIRSILSMSNNRDGGYIILGVEKVNGQYELKGMKKEDIEAYDQDRIFEQIKNYGKPEPRIKVLNIEFQGKNFIVFRVESFSFTPIICNDPHNRLNKLSHLSIYRRTDKPEDKKITDSVELKELIDLAITKEFESWSPRVKMIVQTLIKEIGILSTKTDKSLTEKRIRESTINDYFKEVEDIKKI